MVTDAPIKRELRKKGIITTGTTLRMKLSGNMANLCPDKHQEATIWNGQDSRYD
jgi:hypothetical protein